MLADRHHDWDDERTFQVARRINAALIAKIHTIEWTPAILPHPTTRAALRANWYGLLGPRGSRLLRRLTRSDTLIGIPGSRRDDHGVPFAFTEEFVGVYRMHPLIPDDFPIVRANGDVDAESWPMARLTGTETRAALEELGREDLMTTFGVGRAGRLALHNYPEALRELPRGPADVDAGDHRLIDLATIDIVRDRERSLPRYNDFRRMLRLPPKRLEELAGDDPRTLARLAELYGGDADRVDLMVGLYGEAPPEGFGFSETAFRIFILMASRRLKADPLFTDDWGPGLYTREGLRWIEEATMPSVIARHMPRLAPVMDDVKNAFVPWDLPSNRRSGRSRPFAATAGP
jgi:Animal haem peroxidase